MRAGGQPPVPAELPQPGPLLPLGEPAPPFHEQLQQKSDKPAEAQAHEFRDQPGPVAPPVGVCVGGGRQGERIAQLHGQPGGQQAHQPGRQIPQGEDQEALRHRTDIIDQ